MRSLGTVRLLTQHTEEGALGTRITDETIETLRNVADIAQVVSERVTLKRAGRRLTGLCPFHVEKTPSFSVDPEKQMYHCFGCGAGGDIFSFVMQSEGLSFPEAVKSLADRFGVPLAESQEGDDREAGERQAILEANRVALGVFRHGLLKSPLGGVAREYLEKRGISEDSVARFGLGFIPDGWTRLLDYMTKKGFDPRLLEKSGLVVRSEKGRCYDRFRNRIVFPIQDIPGRVIGFGGRVLGAENPKYLNSPETLLYHKARSLYGLHQGRQEIRKSRVAYIVEGYFDVIALHQHGIGEAVASLGTALTREQIQLLRGYADRLVLVFDGDVAGLRAAERAAPLLLPFAMDCRVLLLPAGEDPDSFVRRLGKDAFLGEALKARPLFSFLMHASLQRWGRDPAGRIKALESLLPLLSGMTDTVVRDVYLREMADGLDMEEKGIRERLSKRIPDSPGMARQIQKSEDPRGNLRMEEALVSLLLSVPQCREEVAGLKPEGFFSDPILKRIVLSLLYGERQDSLVNDPEILGDPEVQRRLSGFAFGESSWNVDNAELLISQFRRLQQQAQGSSGLMDRIKAAEAGKDQARLMALLEQKQQQAREAAKIGLSRVVTPRRHIQ